MAVILLGKGKFGADKTLGSFAEMTQSTTKNSTANETQALDADGAIVGIALTQVGDEITVEALLTDQTQPPEIGDTIAGGYVSNVSVTTSNTDFQRVSVTIKKYADLTLTE